MAETTPGQEAAASALDLGALAGALGGEGEALESLAQAQQEMTDRLLANFPRSIAAFRRYLPDIAETFENYRPSASFEFFCMHNGQANVFLSGQGRVLYPTLAPADFCREQVEALLAEGKFRQVNYPPEHDPFGQIQVRYMNEAIAALKKGMERQHQEPRVSGSVPVIIMLGCGLGYQITELYAHTEVANLIVIEPDPDIFYASLYTLDWEAVLNYTSSEGKSLKIMVGQTPHQLFLDLMAYYNQHGVFLAGYAWPYVHYHSPAIDAMADMLSHEYSNFYMGIGFLDDHLFAVSHACRHILEGREFVRGDTELPGEWLSTPLLVVGNGPSLDH
nr:hypothetical protein [Succinivibrionaceae bacterium]